MEAAAPVEQQGSTGADLKAGSRYGRVLGSDFGGAEGHFAEYRFALDRRVEPATLNVRYARALPGDAVFRVTVDGRDAGEIRLPQTAGWGDRASDFRDIRIGLPNLEKGDHRIRLTVTKFEFPFKPESLPPMPVLDLVGKRNDKNSVGHGKNVALYTGLPSRFFYSTQDLSNVFSAADGQTLDWYPDHVLVTPQGRSAANANLDEISILQGNAPAEAATSTQDVVEQRQVCVTKEDVVVSRIFATNRERRAVDHWVEVTGDCRLSRDYRGKPGGKKETWFLDGVVVLKDHNVFPTALGDGLSVVVGGERPADEVDTATPGAYRMRYRLHLEPGETKSLTLGCAFDPSPRLAARNLFAALDVPDLLTKNRQDWGDFYRDQVPAFSSSDPKIDEIYAFRWFLLMLSRSGGDLGFLQYPVDLEGRQAFQTYCCYSAPFMAFDLNWQVDPQAGFGQLANMNRDAYSDGRFPWYSTPETNEVPLDHDSKTGLSLLPWTAWEFYQVHGRRDLIEQVYDTMKRNVEWWISDRDPDGNGLFTVDHQLETGMDDLHRRWKGPAPKRYEAVDASCYMVLNLRAVANMAKLLGRSEDATRYEGYATKAADAVETILWDPELKRYRDRNPDNGELSDYNSITIFYPMFAGITRPESWSVVDRYLLNPTEYATAWPVPALSQSDPEFDPERRYWAGPTWPAANSHVVDGFAKMAKRLDRTKLVDAGALFRKTLELNMRPRADFYEHYNSKTGAALSTFRDYMHSWWTDTVIRHVAGLNPQDDGTLVIDPLPMGLDHFELVGAPFRGQKVDVLWSKSNGLTVKFDGRVVSRLPKFQPGDSPVAIAVDH